MDMILKNIFIQIKGISKFFHFFKELKGKELVFRGVQTVKYLTSRKLL